MKTQFKLFGALILLLSYFGAQAQAPSIVYNPASYNLILNASVGTITPVNSGGAVPAKVYSTVSLYTGSGANPGTAGSFNGTLASSRYSKPSCIAYDYANNLIYVADAGNDVIRKINLTTNAVTTFAGLVGTAAGNDGSLTTARFNQPNAIAYDGTNTLYIADFGNNAIRKINISTSTVSTITTPLTISQPAGIVYDPANNVVYASNFGRNNILKITNLASTPTIAVFAGSNTAGTAGTTDGTGINARFSGPNGLAIDGSGNLYVADGINGGVRKLTSAGVSSTLATGFTNTRALDVDLSGNIYVTDDSNQIHMVSRSGIVTVVAGTGAIGNTNGRGTVARFNTCRGITVNKLTGDIYICDYGNNAIRKIIGTGYTITPGLSAGLTFDPTTGNITGAPTVRFVATAYTVTAYNASGSSITTITLGCGRIINWTGNANGLNGTKWANTNNWDTNTVPKSADNVQIGVNAYRKNNQPVISTGNVTVNSITFGNTTFGGATTPILTITGGNTLTINSGLTVNAGSTTTLTGGTTNTLIMSPSSTISLLGTGKLALTFASGNFILQSDATGSASIGQILTPGNLTGSALSNVSVQRYINGGSLKYRGYRLLSSPVVNGLDTHGNNVYSINYLKNSIYLTGTSTSGGFDNIVKANPTLYLLRESLTNPSSASFTGGNYRGINNLTASPSYSIDIDGSGFYIPAGNGYLCFIRGDRASTSFTNETKTTYIPQPVTLTATGTLNVGQIIFKPWFNPTSSNLSFTAASPTLNVQGWNLAGNPYASNIDWDQFSSTSSTSGIYGPSVENTMYMLDPITKNYGAYPAGSGGIGTNNATNIIPSGVGFLVHATSSSAQLIFNESAKTTTQAIGASLMLGTPVASNPLQYLRLKLVKDSVNTDETMFRINSKGSLDFVQGLDALYRQGSGYVSLASRSNDQIDIAIKSIVLPKQQGENIHLDVNALLTGIYQITLRDIVAIPRLYDIWLMDNYKKDSLDMRQNLTYSFYIDKRDSTTFGSKRFCLSVRQNPSYVYQLVDFTASKLSTARQVQTNWTTVNEENYTNFTVERSTNNGATFTVLGGVTASGVGSYGLVDKSPVTGTNLYRLKQEDVNNAITYSKLVPIQYSDLSNNLAGHNLGIYPNPASSTINLSIITQDNTAGSVYKIRFMNSSGVKLQEVTSSQPTWQGSVSNLQPGTYIIQVFDNKTQNLIGENKFVKL